MGQAADAAVAGQRTALNLAGASTEDLSRGMMLVARFLFETTRRADVRLTLLASAPRPVRNRSRVHFHSNTMETVAEVALHNAKELAPGTEAFARLKLPAAVLLLPGDRFIIRQFSPVITIGGGTVLDAAPVPRPNRTLLIFCRYSQMEIVSPFCSVVSNAAIAQASPSPNSSLKQDGARVDSISAGSQPSSKKQAHRAGDIFIDGVALAALKTLILAAVAAFHKKNSLSAGIAKEELREQGKASPEVFAVALDQLVREQKIEIAGDIVRLPGHGVTMKDEEAESKKKIEDAFAAAGLKVPALHEVLVRPQNRQNARPKDRHASSAGKIPDQNLRRARLSPHRTRPTAPPDRRPQNQVLPPSMWPRSKT